MFRYFLFLIRSQFKPPLLPVVIVFPVLLMATLLVTFGQAGIVGSSAVAFFITLLLYLRYLSHSVRFGRAIRGFRLLHGIHLASEVSHDRKNSGVSVN